ncbi:hypothetical protein C2S51_038708 [Perilla frutescens var. frutescens]|nr:hypothetical protein C2S51_038708 [Perilla frutescens var. frutescens]
MDSLTTLGVVLLLPIILIIYLRRNGKSVSAKWPPGPKTLPIIGNMHQMSGLPFRCLAELSKQYGPLMRLRLGEMETIVVSSPELAREILKENDPCFADRPQSIGIKVLWYDYIDMAFSPYGEYWKQMRKICMMELLSPRSVRSFASIRRDEVSGLVESIHRLSAGGEPIDISNRIFSMLSSITCRAVFGKVSNDKDTLIKILKDGLQMAGGFEIADFFPSSVVINALSWNKLRLLMMRRRLDVILDGLINQHRENHAEKIMGNGEFGNEDLVDVLLRLQESGELQFPIRNDNIKAVIYDMFSAGTETSATTMDWAMTELMRNPRVMEKVQAEVRGVYDDKTIGSMGDNDQKLEYLKLVIKETLRLHAPVPIVLRASREETQINGYTIPAKVRVFVNSWGMHRDPQYWNNPESFEPERFQGRAKELLGSGDTFDFLPFGGGKRMCPGVTFAMASIELVLAHLLYHFDWKLPQGVDPQTMDMMENPGLTASRKTSLYVIPTPYKP